MPAHEFSTLAGALTAGPASAQAVSSIGPPGSLDTSFGQSGIVRTLVGSDTGGARVRAAFNNGTYVVAGSVDSGAGMRVAVRRYDSRGVVLTKYATPQIGDSDQVSGVAVKDGYTVVAGTTESLSSGRRFFVARYQPKGSLDPLFGGGRGWVTTDIAATTNEQATSVAIDSAGKIVVVGHGSQPQADGSTRRVWAVARYRANGNPDWDFNGGSGPVIVRGDESGVELLHPRGLSLPPDGTILLGGLGSPIVGGVGYTLLAAARLTNQGAPVLSFGTDGVAVTDVGEPVYDGDVAVQNDGKVVAAAATGHKFVVARYLADGTPDGGFGVQGLAFTDFGTGLPALGGIALQPLTDGGTSPQRIVAAGGVNRDFVLARYTATGGPDPYFGGSGVVYTDMGGNDWGEAIVAHGDKFVVAGWSLTANAAYWTLARYEAGLSEAGIE